MRQRGESRSEGIDVKRVVGVVLLSSTLAMIFVVFYVMLNFPDEPEDAPTWWRGSAYSGVVVAIDDAHLTLHADKDIDFKIEPNTRFILRGNSPVRVGAEVKVTFKTLRNKESTTFVARTVRVLRSDTEMPSPSGSPGDAPSLSPGSSPSASGSPATGRSPSTEASGSPAPASAGSASPR